MHSTIYTCTTNRKASSLKPIQFVHLINTKEIMFIRICLKVGLIIKNLRYRKRYANIDYFSTLMSSYESSDNNTSTSVQDIFLLIIN